MYSWLAVSEHCFLIVIHQLWPLQSLLFYTDPGAGVRYRCRYIDTEHSEIIHSLHLDQFQSFNVNDTVVDAPSHS